MSVFSHARFERTSFLGGSDARTIMGNDESALLRLWREKRGEEEPEDLSANLIVQLGTVTERLNHRWYEMNTGQAVTDIQRQVFHPVHRWMAATLDGRVEATGAVFEAKFMLPWNFLGRRRGGKAHGPAAAQHVGDRSAYGSAVYYHRGRQMGGNDHSGRPALSTPPSHG